MTTDTFHLGLAFAAGLITGLALCGLGRLIKAIAFHEATSDPQDRFP